MSFSQKDYSDIIDMECPKSSFYSPMSMAQRAAQFLPFSALTGYEESIENVQEKVENEWERSEKNSEIEYKVVGTDFDFMI